MSRWKQGRQFVCSVTYDEFVAISRALLAGEGALVEVRTVAGESEASVLSAAAFLTRRVPDGMQVVEGRGNAFEGERRGLRLR